MMDEDWFGRMIEGSKKNNEALKERFDPKKIKTKENLIFMFAFFGVITAIGGSYGIAISIVEGIEMALSSIPFWFMSIPSFIAAFVLKKDLNKKPVNR